MNNSMQSAIARSYFGALVHGYNFNLVAIPKDVTIGKDPLAFDPKQMRAAFDAGRALAKQPDPWSHVPPTIHGISDWAFKVLDDLYKK